MSQAAPYIPAKDADWSNWLNNFATLIAASPATYGLMAGDSTTITAQKTAWNSAYALVTSPSTKTPATVQAKNTEKAIALAIIRPYAITISINAGVSSANKIALGVNPRTSTKTPITTPTTNPVLTAQSTSTAGTILRYRDATASPSVKSKPYGVIALLLYKKASATPITDPEELVFVDLYTKSPFQVTSENADVGKTMYWAARWVTRTGLLGPWSPIITYVVAG
jgi:hypothetical protein